MITETGKTIRRVLLANLHSDLLAPTSTVFGRGFKYEMTFPFMLFYRSQNIHPPYSLPDVY